MATAIRNPPRRNDRQPQPLSAVSRSTVSTTTESLICSDKDSISNCHRQGLGCNQQCTCIEMCQNVLAIAWCTTWGLATNTDCSCVSGTPSSSPTPPSGTCEEETIRNCDNQGFTCDNTCQCKPPYQSGGWWSKRDTNINRNFCQAGQTACPVNNKAGTTPAGSFRKTGYECLDLTSNIDSCGGCVSEGRGQDCTAIEGADDVACVNSHCIVTTCSPSYILSENKTSCIYEEATATNGQRLLKTAALKGAEKFWGF